MSDQAETQARTHGHPLSAFQSRELPRLRNRTTAENRDDHTQLWRKRSARILLTLIWARGVIPGLINFTSEKHVSYTIGQILSRNQTAEQVADALSVMLVAYSAWILLHKKRSRWRIAPGFIILAPTVYAIIDLSYRDTVTFQTVAYAATTGLVVAALGALALELSDLALIAYLSAATAAYCLAFMIAAPEQALFADQHGRIVTSSKSILRSGQLAGVFGHSNTLGIYAAMALPFCLLCRSRKAAYVSAGFLVAALIASSSRSALFATGVLMLLAAILTICRPKLQTLVLQTYSCAMLVIVLALPLLVNDPSAFTSRGAIWIYSLRAWERAPLFGSGSDWYEYAGLYVRGLGSQASSGHNLWITWLATGGVSLALVGLVSISSILAAARRQSRATTVPLLHLNLFLTISVLEYIWTGSATSELAWVVLVPFTVLLFHPAPRRDDS